MAEILTVSDYFGIVEPYGDYFLTKYGSLVAAIEIAGQDPDGQNADAKLITSLVAANIYAGLPKAVNITQYYTHFEGAKVRIRSRHHPKHELLSRSRERFLNGKELAYSSIIHYIEIEPEEDLNKLGVLNTFMHLGKAVFEERSRRIVKNTLTPGKALLYEEQALSRLAGALRAILDEVTNKWGALFFARKLSQNETWAHMRFLASLQPQSLQDGFAENIPAENLDVYLAQGDVNPRQVTTPEGGTSDVIKIAGAVNTYVKMAAVRGLTQPGGKVTPGLWAASAAAPARQKGNYVLMTRWKPYTPIQRALVFNSKKRALDRSNLSIMSMLQGGENASILEKQAAMPEAVRRKIRDLSLAEDSYDVDGLGHSYIAVFDTDPSKLVKSTLALRAAASNVGLNLVWESVGADLAFQAFQPGQRTQSMRNLYMSAAQFGAASMVYQSSIGQPVVKDLGQRETGYEEAQYILTSVDATAFHYSPFVNGRAFVIGVGPIRSGKTYAKNSFASHFQKYGGIYRAIDIDAGSEAVANSFGDDAGIFKVGQDGKHGFNFTTVANTSDNGTALAHLITQLHLFLAANDTEEMRSISAAEQRELDKALVRTLEQTDPQLRTLSGLVGHLPHELEAKFARWIKNTENRGGHDGFFAHLFDNEVDAIGALDKPIAVFNLAALRDNVRALRPVLNETFYRITAAFENPALRGVPKWLDIDESHYLLSIDQAAERIVQNVRTWGKHFAGVSLWSQSPEEYSATRGWSAIRSAATTFWFMADPSMTEAVYTKAFPFLTTGQLDAIKNLTPQKQAYIIQPELGVSKVVELDTEMEQYVVNTSHPREAHLRDSLVKQYGFVEGMERAVTLISEMKGADNESTIREKSALLRVVQ